MGSFAGQTRLPPILRIASNKERLYLRRAEHPGRLRSNLTDRTVRIDPPKPHYTLFSTSRGGLPEVVFVNRALLSFLNIEIFPWRLSITITYSDFAENELPSPEESKILNEICDKVEIATLGSKTEFGADNALFVARSTWAGNRELVFQVHDPEIMHNTLQNQVKNEKWRRDWDYEMHHDAGWSDANFYLQLFARADSRDN